MALLTRRFALQRAKPAGTSVVRSAVAVLQVRDQFVEFLVPHLSGFQLADHVAVLAHDQILALQSEEDTEILLRGWRYRTDLEETDL